MWTIHNLFKSQLNTWTSQDGFSLLLLTEIILAPWAATPASLQRFAQIIMKKLEEYFAWSNTRQKKSTANKLQTVPH